MGGMKKNKEVKIKAWAVMKNNEIALYAPNNNLFLIYNSLTLSKLKRQAWLKILKADDCIPVTITIHLKQKKKV